MSRELIVPGRNVDHTFIADGPMPDAEARAELKITPAPAPAPGSIFDLFGKAARLRSTEEIALQIAEERSDWGEP